MSKITSPVFTGQNDGSLYLPIALLAVAAMLAMSGCQPSLPDPVKAAYRYLPDKIDYNFHIKPILSDRCYQCHGPDENTREANLRLDIREEAFARLSSGQRAFVKGSRRRSEAFHRILSDDPDYQMPPPDSKWLDVARYADSHGVSFDGFRNMWPYRVTMTCKQHGTK